MSDPTTHMDASRERLLEESLDRRHRELDRRERIGNRLFAGSFAAVAVALPLLADAERAFSPWLALLFVAAYALVASVEVWGGTAYAVPTQIVFVPMLLLLPTPLVPLLVAAATVISAAAHALRGESSLKRSGLAIADAWFSVGPAVVLIALGASTPAGATGGSSRSRSRRSCSPTAWCRSRACGCSSGCRRPTSCPTC